ncbi:hypothetical protein [uncultured Tenacibaculum sp.]|uniref:hypothetical protein n=1 Tax=uncultured Tenacibaculum sp. TaxID=174713 RepID=UPI00260CB7C3|nr:hypothetical protein [uncultured Tenacibaculum sp.]
MLRFILLLILYFISLFFSSILAQNTANPCNNEAYHQFDFWVGDWDVYDIKGNLIGNNLIKAMPNACAIQENWTSTNGNSLGTSYSYFDRADNKWHQLWIDNKGFVLKTSGNFSQNEMTLQSDLVENQNKKYYNKIIWKKNDNGTVTQTWQYIGSDNKLIKEAFKGIYKRKKS